MSGLNWQNVQIPFSGGMNQKGDKRAQQPPILDIAKDVEFDDVGGLRLRKPYAAIGTNILGGGTIANPRRVVQNGDELLLFTKDTLYSWDAAGSVWVSKGTHLGAAVDEQPLLANTADQSDVECAVFGNLLFTAWNDSTGSITLAVTDRVTGAVIVAPFTFVAAGGPPRLVALGTRVLLFYIASTTTHVYSIDPASLSSAAILASPTATLASSSAATAYFDAVASPDGTKACVAIADAPGTYIVATVDAALTVASVTKSRYSDAIGVAISPDGLWCQIARGHTASGTVTGDLLTFPALADSTINQALGATSPSFTNTIAMAYSSTKVGGNWRCSVFWSIAGGTTKTNHADSNGTIGAETTFKTWSTVASRAFDENGTVFVWLVFSQSNSYAVGTTSDFYSLQNSFFLADAAGSIHAKAAYNTASGNDGRPGSVVALGGGAHLWGGTINRLILLGASSSHGYSQRSPRLITVTFDDNRARRCVRLGRTLYVTGGQILGYDSVQLAEVGFHVSPWRFQLSITGGTGHASAGTYAVKCTYRWDNAQGERERSTTTNVGTQVASLNDEIDIDYIKTTDLTLKGTTPAVEVWRTLVNPTASAPFYLATSLDPTATSNPNRYLANIWTGGAIAGATPAFTDQMSDATLATKENNPENGSVLENLAPPAATIIAADHVRVFLAGVAGSPNLVWYSKQRAEGEIAAFNDALTIQLPATCGDITGLAFLNETLIAFCETGVYALPGDGYDNTGGGNNYGPARLLSSDCGALNQESIALIPQGLIFKSNKGWYLLDKGWNVQYVGAAVVNYDSETPLAVHVVPDQHQVRILSSARMLVWDYLVNQWAEWTIADGLDATIWGTSYLYLSTTGVKQEQSTYTTVNYGMDVETAWIKPADLQGSVSVRRFEVLGEYRSTHHLRIRVAYDYTYDGSGNVVYTDDVYWTPSPTTVGSALQVRHGTTRKKCEAIKVRITASSTNNDGTPPSGGDALKLTGLALQVGQRRGLYQRLPAAQKA